MSKKSKEKIDFRYYEIPQNLPALALLGQSWVRAYGLGIDYLHFHNLLEVGYCLDGEGELIYDGKIIPYRSGTFTVIPKNFPHTTNSKEGTYSSWEYLFIDVNMLRDLYVDDTINAYTIIKRINTRAHCLHKDDYPQLSNLILNILDEMRYHRELYIETSRNLIISLLYNIARLNKSDSEEIKMNASYDSSMISVALEYIAIHYAEEILVSDIADKCHLSEVHFRRLFEKIMNMKPVEYINLVRVNMACEYMKKHDNTMPVVAIKNGFQTTSTMNRNFKKFLNISPYQWKTHPENYEGKLHNFKITAHKGW